MRFFTMEQDKMLPDMIELRDFDIRGPRHVFQKKDAGMIHASTTLYLSEKSGETAPDFIQSPVPLVSDMVKKVLDAYEDDMIFRSVSLVDKERGKILLYHLLLLEEQDMLSEQTEYYPNGTIKRPVLDPGKIKEHKIFAQDGKRFRNPFVSLEIVESLLRRKPAGIIFREVEVE
ncbi:MAG: hypothetical protein HFI17_13625 [Lachnospiraceae bacterium]|jgi:hypothetical protein|nr:hypothetical protein [Lachnospiraceae bacterium]